MAVPQLIVNLFEDELRKHTATLLERVADHYQLDKQELLKRFQPKVIIATNENIVIIRKKKKIMPIDEERCCSRVWNHGKGGQCTRRIKADTLCYQHQKELDQTGELRHGYMTEPAPPSIFALKEGQRVY